MLALLSCFIVSLKALASRNLGMYILLADDTTDYTSTLDWQPQLYPYQLTGADILFLTFINPDLMPAVPPSFARLASTRGTTKEGAVPIGTTIMFAIGGQAYSDDPNPWAFLESKEAAESMAMEVAKWPGMYGCDGIDLDIETGAGQTANAEKYLPIFVAKVKELNPKMIVTQPVFGSPSNVPAANRVVEAAFNETIAPTISPYSLGSIDRVGIMVYAGDSALAWVDGYVNGCTPTYCSEWWCLLAACVPSDKIFLGAMGGADTATIELLANDVVENDLGGVMVWYASVKDASTGAAALVYDASWDASMTADDGTQAAWATALKTMQKGEGRFSSPWF